MLTPKQEAFCLGIAAGKSPVEAYTEAGYQPKATLATRQQGASRMLASKPIAERIAGVRAPAAEKAGITLEFHLADLQRLRDLALDAGQMSAAITAEIARGKASGVWVAEKRELTGQGGGPIQLVGMSAAEFRAMAQRVLAEI